MIIAFIIRAGFGVVLGNRYLPMADQIVFDELARNIADGKGLMITDRLLLPQEDMHEEVKIRFSTMPERIRDLRLNALWGVVVPGTPTAFIEPMVPLTFAMIYKIFGPGLVFPRILHSIFEALVVGMLFSIGRMALPKSRAPGIAALVYAFYPFTIMFSGALITQPMYLFLQCAMIFLFYKFMVKPGWLNAILFGIVFGLTILARITIITFAPVLIFVLLIQDFRKPKYFPALVSILMAGLLLVPWVIRNNNALGKPLLLPTKGGRNFWEYNNQHFTLERLEMKGLQGVDAVNQDFAFANKNKIKGWQFIEFPEFTNENEIERDKILNHKVQQFIRLNPNIYLKLCFLRLYQFFRVEPTHHPNIFFKIAAWGSFGWILPFSIFGGIILWRNWRKLALIYLLILYNTAIHSLTASGIPHRLPIDPFLILLASFAIHWLLEKVGAFKISTDAEAR